MSVNGGGGKTLASKEKVFVGKKINKVRMFGNAIMYIMQLHFRFFL